MKNKITLVLFSFFFLFGIQSTIGQKALIVGFNFDNPDGFSLVALEDLPATEVLFVTETNYDAATNTFDRTDINNNGTWRITWTGTWTKGTVMKFEGASGGTVLTGTSGPGGPGSPTATSPYTDVVSFSNEGFVAFTASNTADPDATPTEIYSYVIYSQTLSGTGPLGDPDPSDDGNCPCSTGFISVDLNLASADDHAQYRPSLRADGTNETRAEFMTPGNWDTDNVGNVALDLTAFTLIVLPIELTTFQAEKENKEVKIKWQTETETNNDYFTVEHSLDGTTFRSLGIIDGAGNSFEPLNYWFRHTTPAIGVNYYRLKQTDFDGAFSYSEIVAVEFRNDDNAIAVYPNPFDQTVTVQFPALEEANTTITLRTIELYDVYGRLAHRAQVPLEETSVTLYLSKLVSGTYFLLTTDGLRTLSTQRIMKL